MRDIETVKTLFKLISWTNRPVPSGVIIKTGQFKGVIVMTGQFK